MVLVLQNARTVQGRVTNPDTDQQALLSSLSTPGRGPADPLRRRQVRVPHAGVRAGRAPGLACGSW